MENYYNTIILSVEDFGENLYVELGYLLRTLFNAGYVCVVREEEAGVIRIDYNYDVYKKLGNPVPMWINDDEMWLLIEDELDNSCCCGKCHNNDK